MDPDESTKTTVYIPYSPVADDEDIKPEYPTLHTNRDLPDGSELRLAAYRAAWEKTHSRLQMVVQSLYEPVINSVVSAVLNAYEDVLLALPYSEVPVITVSAPLAGPSVMRAIATQLEEAKCCVEHLKPSDCTNLMNTMKVLIGSFVDKDSAGANKVKRKPTKSLAAYDIVLLEAWYRAHEERPRLVVLVHDFESLDPLVMQDVFEIFSMHAATLPLTFVLFLSSPTASYLHAAYPRSTLALLRVERFEVPSSQMMLEEMLEKTYFDPMFSPSLVLGPAALEFLGDHFLRWNRSLDSLITILQLAHLHHFTEPLTVLASKSSASSVASQHANARSSLPFFEALMIRLYAQPHGADDGSLEPADKWQNASCESLLRDVETAREEFREATRGIRIGWKVGRIAMRVLDGVSGKRRGVRTQEGSGEGMVETMSACMRGRGAKLFKVKAGDLGTGHAATLLKELEKFFEEINEEEALVQVQDFAMKLDEEQQEQGEIVAEICDWLVSFVSGQVVDLEKCTLWDLWYTGGRPLPSELVNPNMRANVLAGLMHPHLYLSSPLAAEREDEAQEPETTDLASLPDTSILFRRYLDSGKQINVWDWYQSFAAVCEAQREVARTAGRSAAQGRRRSSKSPVKSGRRSPRKASPAKKRDDPPPADASDEADGDWMRQTQARFIRALHELDYLGFIRHTGRKKDCVIRTVWEGDCEDY